MTDQRLDQLSGLVYNYIFSLLDSEDEAGRIAFKVETAFRNAVTAGEPMTCPECGDEVNQPGWCADCDWRIREGMAEDDGQPTEIDEWESFDPDC